MCRMLIAAGEFDLGLLIDELILMAKGENEPHEKNPAPGIWRHEQGWGIAYLKEGKWVIEKSEENISLCPPPEELRNTKTSLAILHVRRKIGGEPTHQDTHPFRYQDSVFCHNGTVKGTIPYGPQFQPTGTTDSEKFFYSLLTDMKTHHPIPDAIKRNVEQYQQYTALNFILANPETSYIYNQGNHNPLYYQMKLGTDKKTVIVSSEKLPHLPNLQWQGLNKGELITINNKTLEVHLDQI